MTEQPGATIAIDLRILDKKIYFTVQNAIDLQKQPDHAGGIGLNNFNKRLALYYPGRYNYEVNKTETTYTASINIDCHA